MGEQKVFGSNVLQEAERQVRMVREACVLRSQGKNKYGDHRRRELSS
jgi:hypothetical protein